MTLIVTFPPLADESGLGYYRRLAAENRFANWREITDTAAVARKETALFASPLHVAEQLGLEPAWATAASRQDDASRRWGGMRRRTDAVCPACLSEESYIRQSWQHAMVVACHQHKLTLVDKCPACREQLTASREFIEVCSCGQDLREVAAVQASSAQRWVAAMIATGGASSSGIAPKLAHATVDQVSSLVRHLCRGPDPTSRGLRPAAKPISVLETVRFLAPLDTLLAEWPLGLVAHVEARVKSGYSLARTPNTLFGGWYTGLKKACLRTPLEPVLGVVVKTAAANFPGVLSLDEAQHLAEDATSYVRCAEAAKEIGVSRSFLVKELKAGKCAYRTKLLGTRGALHEIHKQEVAKVVAARSKWISEDDACAAIGVTGAVLQHMIVAGVIRAEAAWRADLLKGGPIEQASIIELHQRLAAAVHRSPGDRILLRDLTSRRLGDGKAIQSVLKAAACGELRPVLTGRVLGQVAFLRSEVMQYFGTPLLESGMSVQDVSVATGWKWESIAHWIELGLLGAEQILLRGQPCRVISPQQLLAFQRTYIPLADLAKAMNTKSSWLSEQLKTIELIGAQVLPSGARRGGLVRLQDLGRLAIGRATGANET